MIDRVRRRRWCLAVAPVLLAMTLAPASAAAQATGELKRMSLEDLLSVEVTTFSRSARSARAVPAALHVITRDDIRRSGARSLPEVLRLAPGVFVAQQDSSRYAVGIRGFADRLSRSILVLIDGRAGYSPLFAGTYWEVQDTLLEDIDRIEVIRGPGGTMWGANAVNGIINIITRPARDTHGVLVRGGVGSNGAGPFGVRIGGSLGQSGHVRAYAKGGAERPQYHAAGPAFDTWQTIQAGARADWDLAGKRTLTVQGDVYSARQGQRFATAIDAAPFSQNLTRTSPLSGGNVLARWGGPLAGPGEFQLLAYYDRASRDERPVVEVRDTASVDFQYRPRRWTRHDVSWGVGYRASRGRITATAPTRFEPETRVDQVGSAFVHDDFTLVPRRLRLIGGAKVEHNGYSGVEVQPSVRLQWALTPAGSVIASVTRAVRTPSRVETDYTTTSISNPSVPAFVRLVPNPAFEPEKVIAYEAGYRAQLGGRVYVTWAGFFNQLDDVLSTELLTPLVETTPPPERLILPVTFRNGLHGNSHGAEATVDWRLTGWLRATGAYSLIRIQLTKDPGSADVSQERRREGLAPRHQTECALAVDLPRSLQFDWSWRRMSGLPAGPVPGYSTSDARLSWEARRGLEVALVGRNLQQARHLEWPSGSGNAEIRRSIAMHVTWQR